MLLLLLVTFRIIGTTAIDNTTASTVAIAATDADAATAAAVFRCEFTLIFRIICTPR